MSSHILLTWWMVVRRTSLHVFYFRPVLQCSWNFTVYAGGKINVALNQVFQLTTRLRNAMTLLQCSKPGSARDGRVWCSCMWAGERQGYDTCAERAAMHGSIRRCVLLLERCSVACVKCCWSAQRWEGQPFLKDGGYSRVLSESWISTWIQLLFMCRCRWCI